MANKPGPSVPQAGIPVVDFYGENTDWPVADLLHCEYLQVRSALHDWQIKPHRHRGLLQIFFVQAGSGQAQVDSVDMEIPASSVLVVPEMCVHKFMWEAGSQGFVLFIARPLLDRLNEAFAGQDWGGERAAVYPVGEDLSFIEQSFATIAREYLQQRRNRAMLMETQVQALAIWLSRQQAAAHGLQRRSRAEERLARFLELLETHYRQQHSVAWYAAQTGISAPHLNTLCQAHKGLSALGLIHQRLLMEAQRSLIYTSRTATEIADHLGFSEPAYFSRFFKRLTGLTPRQFRQQTLADSAH